MFIFLGNYLFMLLLLLVHSLKGYLAMKGPSECLAYLHTTGGLNLNVLFLTPHLCCICKWVFMCYY